MTFFCRDKLKAYLSKKLDAEELSIGSTTRRIEGWSMETFSLGVSYFKDGKRIEKDLIIRMEPRSGLLEPYDALMEYKVLYQLHRAGLRVPEPYWYEPDPAVLGAPFYAMERVLGKVHQWSVFRAALDSSFRLIPDDEERLKLAQDFVDNIAMIHILDWQAWGLNFLKNPGPGTQSALSQVELWESVIERTGARNKPVVAYATNWLKDHLVENDQVRLLHGDYRPGNFVIREKRIVAILDWEMAHLGDPIEDVSYILGSPWRSAWPRKWVCHLLPEEDFFSLYEEKSGIRIDRDKLKFYNVLAEYKLMAVGFSAARIFSTQDNPDLRTGVIGTNPYVALFNIMRAIN